MSEEIRKRSVSRRRSVSAAASSSAEGGAPPVEPIGSSVCGHSGCQRTCNVRYVGPVSHIRDHHALHAAQGVSHIWSASIITGFAIVLTGAIAFQTVQAKTDRETAAGKQALQSENAQLVERLNRLEALMLETRRACRGEAAPSVPLTEAERRMLRNERSTSTRDGAPTTTEQGGGAPGYVPSPFKKN